MLSDKVKEYLRVSQDDFIEFMPTYQEVLREFAKKNKLNSESFVEFMSKYDSEIHGSEGLIINSLDDLYEYETSIAKHLRDNYGVPEKYISLFNLEVDDYLLYNKDDDSVVLIEGGNDIKLKKEEFDKKWNSFNEFLEDFFELN